MPTSSEEVVLRQQDRARREQRQRPDEPRKFDVSSHDTAAADSPYAGFDADLNPIDDELINTHGSER